MVTSINVEQSRDEVVSRAPIGSLIVLGGKEYLVCITDDGRRYLTPLSIKKQAA